MLLGDESKTNHISSFEKRLKLFTLPVTRNAIDVNNKIATQKNNNVLIYSVKKFQKIFFNL
jgi:hypothetical protein